jgi:hypothetical protein
MLPKALEWHSQTFHELLRSQLFSTWVGDVKWAAANLYGGVGINSFETQIKGKNSDLVERQEQVAPSAVAGVSLRLLIFDLTSEVSVANIKYRDGKTKTVRTSAGMASLHVAF